MTRYFVLTVNTVRELQPRAVCVSLRQRRLSGSFLSMTFVLQLIGLATVSFSSGNGGGSGDMKLRRR